jgi:alginate O-acetyltransferase complex protein AlgI
LVFYAWGAPKLVFYLAAACAVDYVASRFIAANQNRPSRAKAIVAATLVANVALLVYFKYANFFVHEVNRAFVFLGRPPLAWTEVALPIGISFFTFHRVSYIVDVYRGVTGPAKSYRDYLLYVVLFPQLIAGPIIRYHDVADEISLRTHSLELFFEGTWRFSLGLGKKVLVANVLGEAADRIFGAPALSLPASLAWAGILCYSFQIYFDFSGYSDMALGLGKMMGIHFRENFDRPYISQSITEFWRRWHISLSSFMKDYLYIPLGGSRRGPGRTYLNLWIVFLISGFWHGASWNFLLWGAYHGLFLVIDKLFWSEAVKRIPKAAAVGITFLIVMFGWILFRAPDLPHAAAYAGRMLGLTRVVPAPPVPAGQDVLTTRTLATLLIALAISFLPAWDGMERLRRAGRVRLPGETITALRFVGVTLLMLVSVSYLATSSFNPFIYFRF